MQTANHSNRLKELVGKIKTERDQEKFTALVEELNRLLDGDQTVRIPPKAGT